ncbi:copper amine oxidase N-terminal domain-containing protein [Paenibacillus xylaniclasticus]|uniref:copper amine oxidase N-terminal domain-containing protein n=1 Tax=Paenibacillus xylaniclasticus TaxID=588083 RepID=UPI0013DE7D55|nr:MULTISPECIES: copper amine oxidase N-terminal domain-containing protein [Paenibacillus]GFN32620.1 hypothetical protein PCURB6_28800 [Paenibacillus curdlanolyticus]
MTIGSISATINGAAAKVQPPVNSSGTTLVPLNAVARAFGIVLSVQKDNINLQYDSLTVALSVDSNVAKVNGEKTQLASAPKRVNDVTMVPVTIFKQYFGAAIALTGNSITIKGSKNSGYTQVGDSYYGWSMNYPIGMEIRSLSDMGDSVGWYDSIGNRLMDLNVVGLVDLEYKRKIIIGDDKILEKTSTVIQGVTFDIWVTRDQFGHYYEYRFTKKGNNVYILSAGGNTTNNREALLKYKSQLDSFRLTFSKSDKKLKDITRIRNGMIRFEDMEYGLQVDLPMSWTRSKDADESLFEGEDGSLEVFVVSASVGETAMQWSARSEEKLSDQYVDGYLSNVDRYSISFNKGQGYVLQYDYKVEEEKWVRAYTIYYISGDHKYEALLTFPIGNFVNSKIDKSKKLFDAIAGSMTFDTSYVDNNLGYIEDKAARDGEFVKIKSKAFGYTLEIPATWHNFGEDVDIGFVNVQIPHDGIFQISVDPEEEADEWVQQLLSLGFRKTEVEVNGVPFIRLDKDDDVIEGVPARSTVYLVKHNGSTYHFYFSINHANDTSSFRDDVERVMQSLTFTY